MHRAWWHVPIIPALRRWRLVEKEFKAGLDYIASLRLD